MTAISQLTAPHFRINLLGANVFVPDNRPGLTGIALELQIWNTGEPSIAVGWSLRVTLASGTVVPAQFTRMPDTLVLKGDSNVLNGKDALDVKTEQTEIGKKPLRGNVLFYIALSKDDVLNPATKLEVFVQDMYQQTYNASKAISDWL